MSDTNLDASHIPILTKALRQFHSHGILKDFVVVSALFERLEPRYMSVEVIRRVEAEAKSVVTSNLISILRIQNNPLPILRHNAKGWCLFPCQRPLSVAGHVSCRSTYFCEPCFDEIMRVGQEALAGVCPSEFPWLLIVHQWQI